MCNTNTASVAQKCPKVQTKGDLDVAAEAPQGDIESVLQVWEEFGVVLRIQNANSHRLYIRSDLDAKTEGMCPACGLRGKALKQRFFKPIMCQKCETEGYFHIKYTDQR